MTVITASGSALIMPSAYARSDMETAKFSVTNGTVSLNISAGGTTGAVGTANPFPVTQATLTAGEDLTNNVTKVEERFSYYNHVGTAGSVSGTVKSGAGFLHTLNFGKHTTGGTYTLYDSVGTSGTVVSIISSDGAAVPTLYDVSYTNGLTIVSGSVCNLTFSYR